MALLFADGSCEGNGSPNARGAAAYVLLPGDSVTIREGFKVNQRPDVPVTVNVCEYAAVLAGLKHALKLGVSNIEVRTDSQLVVKQLNGEWKINYPWFKELNTEIRGIAKRFAKCEFVWIPREENVEADRIAYATLFDRPWKELESEPFPVLSNVATNVVSVIPTTEQVNRLADKIQGKRCEDGCKESPCSVELASPMLRALVKDRGAYEKMANSYAQDMLKAIFKVERLERRLISCHCGEDRDPGR